MIRTIWLIAFVLRPCLPGSGANVGNEHLKPLEFLIGTWTGGGESAELGKYTEVHVIEWMHDRNFIRAEYTLKREGAVAWTATSIIGYDEQRKKLVDYVFARNGAIARGEEVRSDGKGTVVFENQVVGIAEIKEDRVTQTKVDEDTFTSTVEVRKDGKYVLVGTYTYRRKK
jgi:hypothetical protein